MCLAIENKFSENVAINFLCENESFQAYQRKRLSQSFEQLQTLPKKGAMQLILLLRHIKI